MEIPTKWGVFNPSGLSPCLACGQHAGVEPKIIEIVYEQQESDTTPLQ